MRHEPRRDRSPAAPPAVAEPRADTRFPVRWPWAVEASTGNVGDPCCLGAPQWLAALYLGAFGAALTFYLWAFALERTTPTRVAISVTVNPITASIVGAVLLHEPLSWNLAAGIVTVFIGIAIATTTAGPAMVLAPRRTEPNMRERQQTRRAGP